MNPYKENIPKALLIEAFNQIRNYLFSQNRFPDLPDISVEKFGADVMFGGEGEFTEEDEEKVRILLTELADNVAKEIFLVNRGRKKIRAGYEKGEYPSIMTGLVFGFDLLFLKVAPELL